MNHPSYKYDSQVAFRYTFTSIGHTQIQKVVVFAPTTFENIYNVGFGDLLADGSIDDKISSNNGDIVKVLSTIIQILREFTLNKPGIKIVFAGSNTTRTKLYQRMLVTYYDIFSKEFIISGLIETESGYAEIEFTVRSSKKFLAFFITRIN